MFCNVCDSLAASLLYIAVTYQNVQLHLFFFFFCLCVLRMSTIMAVISQHRIQTFISSGTTPPPSLPISSPSHLSSPLCCHTLLTCVCALVPFLRDLTVEVVAVSGFLFFWFTLSLFFLSLETKKQLLSFFFVQDMPSILCQAQNMGLSLRLY